MHALVRLHVDVFFEDVMHQLKHVRQRSDGFRRQARFNGVAGVLLGTVQSLIACCSADFALLPATVEASRIDDDGGMDDDDMQK
jgi:hypothetical protein